MLHTDGPGLTHSTPPGSSRRGEKLQKIRSVFDRDGSELFQAASGMTRHFWRILLYWSHRLGFNMQILLCEKLRSQ